MAWNFCPWCSHRTYQHASHGCTHVEVAGEAKVPCDCKRPHQLMVEEIGG